MELEKAREILAAYQRELDHEAAGRRLQVERPINLLALPESSQVSLAQEIAALLSEPVEAPGGETA